MSLTKTTVLTAAATIAALAMTGGAFAKTFEAIYTVSIHSQATKKSSVVDKLFEGEHVKINSCDDDWCMIIHDGPDGWVPLASLEKVGGGYSGGPDIVIQGGFDFGHHPKKPGGGIIVDPGPHKPKFPGQINVGDLPVSVFDPGTGNGGNGGGNGGGGTVHPVHPVFPVNGGTLTPTGGTGGGCVKFCGVGGTHGPIHMP